MSENKEISKSLRNSMKWPFLLCQLGGSIFFQLRRNSQLKFSFFSCPMFISIFHLVCQCFCFLLLFFYQNLSLQVIGLTTPTELYTNYAINFGYFIAQVILRIVFIVRRKEVEGFQNIFIQTVYQIHGESFNPANRDREKVFGNPWNSIEKQFKLVSISILCIVIFNIFGVFTAYAIPGLSQTNTLENNLVILLIVLMACDFSSVFVLYNALVIWIAYYLELIILGFQNIRMNLHKPNLQTLCLLESKQPYRYLDIKELETKIAHFEQIKGFICKLNSGPISVLLLVWLVTTGAMALFTGFSIILNLRQFDFIKAGGMVVMLSMNLGSMYVICNYGERLTFEVI